MEYVDHDTWPRREVFDHFSACSNPFYSVTYRQDVTALVEHCRASGLSFYLSLVWLSTKALNSVENFRYTVDGGRVALLSERIPSFCDLRPGSELFHIVTLPAGGDMAAFCAAAREKSAAQTVFLDQTSEGASLIYFSCAPWFDLTALTNERDFDRDDAIPRVAWGRYVEENGRKTLGMSLEVNHRFVDGYHIGKFAEELTKRIDSLA
ncbi:MAG: chloramphenicol acetyltransferase [Ruminococcaceae bacterium]|nr:chloramphenicol acetyltransferase [Oscillospiraceae bacterium]